MGHKLFLLSPGDQKVKVISVLKAHLGFNTVEAKRLMDQCPTLVGSDLDHQTAFQAQKALQAAGAQVQVDELPVNGSTGARNAVRSAASHGYVGERIQDLAIQASKKDRAGLERAFPNAAADEVVLADFVVVSDLSGADPGWMLFTQYRFAFGNSARRFGAATVAGTFGIRDVQLLEFGESSYTHHRGLQSTKYYRRLTIRIHLTLGRRYERHISLGDSERTYNQRMPPIVESVAVLARHGYPCAGGSGYDVAGGTSVSFGTGFGVWGG